MTSSLAGGVMRTTFSTHLRVRGWQSSRRFLGMWNAPKHFGNPEPSLPPARRPSGESRDPTSLVRVSQDIVSQRQGTTPHVGPERAPVPDVAEYRHLTRPTGTHPLAFPWSRNLPSEYNPQSGPLNPRNTWGTFLWLALKAPRILFYCEFTNKWYFWKDPLTGRYLIFQRCIFLFIVLPLFAYSLLWGYEDIKYKWVPWVKRIIHGKKAARAARRREIEAALAAEGYATS